MQIIVLSRDVYILFSNFFVFLYQFLTKLTLLYSYNWQKFNNKMNEKKKPRVSSCSGLSFETILPFDFWTITEILVCCSLIKCFPNSHKRYSSHLQLSILHRVAPIKVYLKFMTPLKQLFKKGFCTINKQFLTNLLSPRAAFI